MAFSKDKVLGLFGSLANNYVEMSGLQVTLASTFPRCAATASPYEKR